MLQPGAPCPFFLIPLFTLSPNFPRLEDVCEQRERRRRDPDGVLGTEAPPRALHHRHAAHAHGDHAVPRGAARPGPGTLQPVLSGGTGDSRPGRTCPRSAGMEPQPAGCGWAGCGSAGAPQGHTGRPRGWVWTTGTVFCPFS